jgi:small conductance mechanosensitive channel
MHLSLPLCDLFDEFNLNGNLITIWTSRIFGLVVVWVAVWVLVKYLSRWITRLDEHVETFDVDPRDMKTLDRLLDYVVILLGGIVSLSILGWTSLLYSALTAAGVFSVILGFAVKDVAANFVSGIFLLIDQPFAPGDFIEVGEHSGSVDNISLRTTTLVTLDGPVVHIPNSVLAVQPTINYSVAEVRRINFVVSITNDADTQQALKTIQRVLAEEEGLLAERGQSVLVQAVREYAVDVDVACYAPKDTFLTLASDLRRRVVDALQQAGIELAVPVRKNVNLDLVGAGMAAPDEQ